MIEEMKAENFADEIETLTRRRRKSQLRKRMVEGPRDPWRATRHGPLREVILTANCEWFEEMVADENGKIDFRKREREFEAAATALLRENFGEDVVHVLDPETGHRWQSEQRRSPDPPVSGKDRSLAIDQHGVGEAEGLDAVGDLPDLLL